MIIWQIQQRLFIAQCFHTWKLCIIYTFTFLKLSSKGVAPNFDKAKNFSANSGLDIERRAIEKERYEERIMKTEKEDNDTMIGVLMMSSMRVCQSMRA